MKPKSESRKSAAVTKGTLGAWVILLSLLLGCRQDMHVQPKYVPEDPSSFFADGRSERPLVAGTVARGQLRADELLYTGTTNGTVSYLFPFPITSADLSLRPEPYNILFSPCLAFTGRGHAMYVHFLVP